jgi:hypothetical protein
METPLDCARTVADFLTEKLREYDEMEQETGKNYEAYAGFLPVRRKAADMKENCPFVAVRPVQVVDGKEHSIARMAVFVTTYGEDPRFGSESLYHLLEFLRFCLLSGNPVRKKYQIRLEGDSPMETYVPDEQPYPFWEGRMDFAVYLEQPSNGKYVAGFNMWRRQRDERDRKKGR